MIIITGQTAAGKTSHALDLASKINGELINIDSRQIYKKLDIITGKDLTDKNFIFERTQNKHDIGFYKIDHFNNRINVWLYDTTDPKQYFSSYDYKQCAMAVIEILQSQNKTPIFVGGTYLYIRHLLYGIDTDSIPPDFNLRRELNKLTVEELQTKLKRIDSTAYESMNNSDRNNSRRLIRRIEIVRASQAHPKGVNTHGVVPVLINDYKIIGFKFASKDALIKRIKERVEDRLKKGAIEEVEDLLKLGYNENDPGLRTLGYASIIKYLRNDINKEAAITEWITKEIQYAKRQLTFMKTDPNIQWKEIIT